MSNSISLSIEQFLEKTKKVKIAEALRELEELKCSPKGIFEFGLNFKSLADYTLFLTILYQKNIFILDFPRPVALCNANAIGYHSDQENEFREKRDEKFSFDFWFNLKD